MDTMHTPTFHQADIGRFGLIASCIPNDRYFTVDLRTRGDLDAMDRRSTVLEIASRRGIKPIQSIEELRGNFWPEEDDLDDFLVEWRRWRGGHDEEGSS
jgi:hypothetical protein